MDPMIVWTNANRVEVGGSWEFTLDLAYGSGDSSNDFTLTLPVDARPPAGGMAFVDGTGWGGMIDACVSDTDVAGTLNWYGRTWHGILQRKVLCPDSGQSHLVLSGSVSDCIGAIIARCGLGALMEVGDCPTELVSYQFYRYDDAWHGLRAMLATVDMRPTFDVVRTGGVVRVLVGAVHRTANSGVADTDLGVHLTTTKRWRCTNHLVCLGAGELQNRLVRHLYADDSGNVSTTQSLIGTAEVAQAYELSSVSDAAELVAQGTAKLRELQVHGEVEVTVDEDSPLDVGDVVNAYDARVDVAASAEIGEVVVKIKNGVTRVTRETGTVEESGEKE